MIGGVVLETENIRDVAPGRELTGGDHSECDVARDWWLAAGVISGQVRLSAPSNSDEILRLNSIYAGISTNVDGDLLTQARTLHGGATDASLFDEALGALVTRYRAAEVEAVYAKAYDAHPLDDLTKRVLVAPCTTTIRGLASEVVLEPGDDPIGRRSAVNLDSVESVSLVTRIARLSDTRMRQICAALEIALDCRS